MKNVLLLSLGLVFIAGKCLGASGCNIDSSNAQMFAPHSDSLPCVERGVLYDQSIQMAIPIAVNLQDLDPTVPIAYGLFVDSLIIDSITGLPNGINYYVNPANGKLYGGSYGCINLAGTTNASTGLYTFIIHGNITLHGQPFGNLFDGDTTMDLVNLQGYPDSPFKFWLQVTNPGDTCTHLTDSIHAPAALCTIDTSNTLFFSPGSSTLPCIERGVPYHQIIQVAVPIAINLQDLVPSLPIAFGLFVDSVIIDSITGFPSGITLVFNPATRKFYGGDHGCVDVSGITNAAKGIYHLVFHGTITLHGQPFGSYFDGDTTVSLQNLQANPNSPFKFTAQVINPGDSCTHLIAAGINNNRSGLNAVFKIYPNPGSGIFRFDMNSGKTIEGEINVLDYMGRLVLTRSVDVSGPFNTSIDLSGEAQGIYVVQLKTAEGVASKNISLQ
jgi:hypothetical protein